MQYRPRTLCRTLALGLALGLAPGGPAEAERYDLWTTSVGELDFSTRRGLRYRFDDIDLQLRLGGRFHGDLAFFLDDDFSLDHEAEARRARVYLTGEGFEHWSFKVEHEFAEGRAGWRNLWLRFKPTKESYIRAGNFVAPFGLEEVAASNYATFMERALPTALAPTFGTGVALHHHGRFFDGSLGSKWSATTSITVEPLGDNDADRHRSEHWASSTRVTFAPVHRKRVLIHLGGAFEYRDVDGGRYRIASRPESSITPNLLNTGTLPDVARTLAFGLEAATMLGPFSAQAEYMRASLERKTAADPEFDGWYAQVALTLTGESRRYSRSHGTFRGIDPESSWGAVEVALRYSTLDLMDGGIAGGDLDAVAAGLNWYLRENLRLMFNYVRADGRAAGTLGSGEADVVQGRVLFFF